ncbi:hypothetical protein BDF14DRAFT_1748161 [Spinellus fusiger]|nr:hypothetical protein BDF14DRAFT_1748161 [Spinellus fusiger]
MHVQQHYASVTAIITSITMSLPNIQAASIYSYRESNTFRKRSETEDSTEVTTENTATILHLENEGAILQEKKQNKSAITAMSATLYELSEKLNDSISDDQNSLDVTQQNGLLSIPSLEQKDSIVTFPPIEDINVANVEAAKTNDVNSVYIHEGTTAVENEKVETEIIQEKKTPPFANLRKAGYNVDNKAFDPVSQETTTQKKLTNKHASLDDVFITASTNEGSAQNQQALTLESAAHSELSSASDMHILKSPQAWSTKDLGKNQPIYWPEIKTSIKNQEEKAIEELEQQISETLKQAVETLSKNRPAPWTDDPLELYLAYTQPVPSHKPAHGSHKKKVSSKRKLESRSTSHYNSSDLIENIFYFLVFGCILVWILVRVLKIPVTKCRLTFSMTEKTIPLHYCTRQKTVD